MKNKLLLTVLAMLFSGSALALEVKVADKAWDGMMVPEGQQCQKFGGDSPMTPKLKIKGIPKGSDSLLLEYSDRDSERMNNGGHGRMQFALKANAKKVTVPSVPGHSYELPKGFTMVEAHRGPGWDKEGAYMPPCSGGNDHAYYVTVKSLQGDKVLAETVVELGKY
ncbi:hypothetical protein [Reinekea thalattae]|uniref:YbhB/YbcL family Raf kinase inhibitor-like protein n=1 Tax=Reinekea thalattae TaxID=2593301 RepID=A0A5C8Z9M0_9GAMM|nr:hypothetical protein [Reinekea thalattae]TXR53979.1 hypothetical protein FME95_05365 [Reinekea thalattae]